MGRVSFSQYNMWNSCPQQYKLNYIDKLGESSGNIHTIFGTAMHETIQHFLDVMYNVTKKQAMSIDLDLLLKDKLIEAFNAEKKKQGDRLPTTQIELEEFFGDGRQILKFFKSKLAKILSKLLGGSQADTRKFSNNGTTVDSGEDKSLKAGNGAAQAYKVMKVVATAGNAAVYETTAVAAAATLVPDGLINLTLSWNVRIAVLSSFLGLKNGLTLST